MIELIDGRPLRRLIMGCLAASAVAALPTARLAAQANNPADLLISGYGHSSGYGHVGRRPTGATGHVVGGGISVGVGWSECAVTFNRDCEVEVGYSPTLAPLTLADGQHGRFDTHRYDARVRVRLGAKTPPNASWWRYQRLTLGAGVSYTRVPIVPEPVEEGPTLGLTAGLELGAKRPRRIYGGYLKVIVDAWVGVVQPGSAPFLARAGLLWRLPPTAAENTSRSAR